MVIDNYIFSSYRQEQQTNRRSDSSLFLEKNGFIVYNKEKKYDADRKVYSYK